MEPEAKMPQASDTDSITEEQSQLPLVKSIIGSDEIEHFKELGLGRAIDASNPSPWLNKSSFQVRNVTPDCIMGTEEGGFLQRYVNEVYSGDRLQAKLSTSISDGSKVKVGVDADMSRRHSTSLKTAGKKIVTRSIFFKPDFSIPHLYNTAASKEGEGHSTSSALPNTVDFEQRLVLWVLESLVNEYESQHGEHQGLAGESEVKQAKSKHDTEGEPEKDDLFVKLIIFASLSDDKETKILQRKCREITKAWSYPQKVTYVQKKCREFVWEFQATHYISGITLGASLYRVSTKKDYQQEIAAKGTLEVLQFESVSAEVQKTSSFSQEVSSFSYIGRFSGATVQKEAVMEAELEPVSSLIKFKLLRKLLQKALRMYIEDHERSGPYIISCNNDCLFLKVNSEFQVVATDLESIKQSLSSAQFSITSNMEEEASDYNFSICHSPSHHLVCCLGEDVSTIPLYLYSKVDFWGRNEGPLKVGLDADIRHTTLTLRSRQLDSEPIRYEDWWESNDVFYICCKQRFFGRNSYLCVKPKPAHMKDVEGEYITCCVPTIKESNGHMLFRLIRASSIREKKIPETDDLDSEASIKHSSKDKELL